MQRVTVDINISKDEWLKTYKGHANLVHAKSRDGLAVQFPANILSKYTTRSGIHGSFSILYTASGKFQSIVKL